MSQNMESLKLLLANLKNEGIETKSFDNISTTIELGLSTHILLIDNDTLRLTFDIPTKEMKFSTSFSGIPITDMFLGQVMEVQELLPMIEMAMNNIADEWKSCTDKEMA